MVSPNQFELTDTIKQTWQQYPSALPGDSHWKEDLGEALLNPSHFVEPADATLYEDYRYVGTHNAFAYPRPFKVVRQQDQTIIGHLTFGVRGLMLDTYDWSAASTAAKVFGKLGTGDVVLSHPGIEEMSIAQKGAQPYQTLKYELRRVVEFLKMNTKAVVTIILEDYANAAVTAHEIEATITDGGLRAGELLFKPSDLASLNGRFPTLGWMRQHSKRLVIFTQNAPQTATTFHQFDHFYENGYGTSDETAMTTERRESAAVPASTVRKLVVFNNFPGAGQGSGVTPTVAMQKDRVGYSNARDIVTKAKNRGFAGGRLFNGYWADRVVDCVDTLNDDLVPTVFNYVNELNAGHSASAVFGKGYHIRSASHPARQLSFIHTTHAGGTYYGWGDQNPCAHQFDAGPGQTRLVNGSHLYLRTTQSDAKGYVFLNAEDSNNLWYSKNAASDEEWIIERVGNVANGDIRVGETVRFRSVRQTKEANNAARYLSVESDKYLATRALNDRDAKNWGIDWVIED